MCVSVCLSVREVCADNLADAVDRLLISGSIGLSVNALPTEGNFPLVRLPTGKYSLKVEVEYVQNVFAVYCSLHSQ